MGKLLCDSTTVPDSFQPSSTIVPWRDPKSTPLETIKPVDLVHQTTIAAGAAAWDDVLGLEDQQRRHLQRLQSKGVLWKPPGDDPSSTLRSVVFRLSHGGEVSADGNCLFTASQKAMGGDIDARDLRKRTVSRFLEDLGSVSFQEREGINDAIRHMYSPDLKSGWGVHVVQEVKLLAGKVDRLALDSAIAELVQLGIQRYCVSSAHSCTSCF